ncbi:glycosyltransferase family 2 protein [Microseira sp. BLCC-F43]|jgi:cellulose synthase/poly-beta-1,6-N-acetylglucosamine synthase-like glycosyltransferase|uniref:glycosyltransferase family 2 protein n=1 Tax=Microseira sp. BLCC-F43 TaxID=3153602 RepID=UPI0035BA07FB
MHLLVNIALLVIALGIGVPIAVLLIECGAALLPDGGEKWDVGGDRPRVAVLIPAHNEAADIRETLLTIMPQLTELDRVVVIADNCTDETAAIARASGAKVIERINPDLRGKGYALDYGLRFIKLDPPDVVVVIDADCIVHTGTIDRIVRQAMALKRPVQATYLMKQKDNPGLKDSISMLAIKVKNLVRFRGLQRLGCPVLLTGSGMAFPWSAISKVCLAGGKTADDMQLSVDLSIAGYPPAFAQEAEITGRLMKQEAAKSQRTRWEHGHLEMILTQVPLLLKESVRQRRFDLLAIALDLCIPPLSLLVVIWTAAIGVALLAGVLGASWIPTNFLAIEGLLIFVSIVGSWAKFGYDELPALTLLAVPFYILWKIPLYLAFLIQRQTTWSRTERDIVDPPEIGLDELLTRGIQR